MFASENRTGDVSIGSDSTVKCRPAGFSGLAFHGFAREINTARLFEKVRAVTDDKRLAVTEKSYDFHREG